MCQNSLNHKFENILQKKIIFFSDQPIIQTTCETYFWGCKHFSTLAPDDFLWAVCLTRWNDWSEMWLIGSGCVNLVL